MKYLISAIFAMLLLAACSSKEAKQTEQNLGTEAEIEAAMMEGREAGRSVVNREWRDTMQLQLYILDARAKRDKYEISGKPECAKAFDQGFVKLVYSVKPELAEKLFPDSMLNSKDQKKN